MRKIAAEDRIAKQEEILKEKIDSLKAREKGEKSKSRDQRLVNLQTALAEAGGENMDMDTWCIEYGHGKWGMVYLIMVHSAHQHYVPSPVHGVW